MIYIFLEAVLHLGNLKYMFEITSHIFFKGPWKADVSYRKSPIFFSTAVILKLFAVVFILVKQMFSIISEAKSIILPGGNPIVLYHFFPLVIHIT